MADQPGVWMHGAHVGTLSQEDGRLADLARATQATFQDQGNARPIIDQIVTLIDQRCTLTVRRFTAPEDDFPPPASKRQKAAFYRPCTRPSPV